MEPSINEQITDDSNTNDIYLPQITATLWERKALIAAAWLFGVLGSLVYAYNLNDEYSASMIIAPKQSQGGAGLMNSLAGQYGAIASIAGINLGSDSGASKNRIALATLSSREFFKLYIYEEVLVELMAATSWEKIDNQLNLDASIYDNKKSAWVRDSQPPRSAKPSVQEAHKEFLKLFSVLDNKSSGLITLSIRHISPHVAKHWLDLVYSSINLAIKTKDLSEATLAIEFLNEQRSKTSLVSINEVFYQLIEQQTKTIMLANISDDYIFEVIDPAFAPEEKIGPNRFLILLLGQLLAIALAIFGILFRLLYFKDSRQLY